MNEQTEPGSDPIERAGSEERDYLLGRAAAHKAMAISTDEQGPRMIHSRLEELYRERATRVNLVG